MTEEEIEEQADIYANEKVAEIRTGKNSYNTLQMWCDRASGFVDGAKWGIANAIEWHDLREKTDDLPKCAENKQIIFYVKEFNTDIEKDTSHFCLGFYAKSFMNNDLKVFIERSKGYECEHLSQEVIAWCELPIYKE